MNYLYIGGPSRSGTTALTSYLNRHPEMMICRERFKWIPRRDLTPKVFTFERIMDFEDGYEKRDTDPRRKQVHEELVNSKDPEKLRWMGDKYPGYVRMLDELSENNPGASFILTYRPVEEVAESFEDRSRNPGDAWLGGRDGFRLGVEAWNKAMRHTRDFIESSVNPNVLVVGYHDFFYRNEGFMPLLSRFLDLEFDEEVLRSWREESRSFEDERREKEPVNEEQQALIDEHADREAESYVLRRMEEQYEELDLYSPEATRRLINERRRSSVRIAGERNAVKTVRRELENRDEKIEVLTEENERLARRVRNLEQQMRAIRSSRSWRLLATLAAGRKRALGGGKKPAAGLAGSVRDGKPGSGSSFTPDKEPSEESERDAGP